MKRIRTVIWPFAAAGVCLLGLALLAPLAWRGELPPTLHDHPAVPRPLITARHLARWSRETARPAPWWKSELGASGATAHLPGATPIEPPATEIPPPLPDFVEAEAGTILLGDDLDAALVAYDMPEDRHLELARELLVERRAAQGDEPRMVPSLHGSLPQGAWLAQVHPHVSAQHGAAPERGPVAGPRLAKLEPPGTAAGEWPRLDSQPAGGVWPVPAALIQQLEGVRDNPLGPDWARQVAVALAAPQQAPSRGSSESAAALAKLRELGARVERLSLRQDSTGELLLHFAMLRRAAYAVARRVDLWQHVQKAEAAPASPSDSAPISTSPPTAPPMPLSEILADLGPVLGGGESGRRWKAHLRWDELAALAANEKMLDGAPVAADNLRGQTARAVLRRLEQSKAGAAQQTFLQRAPFVSLQRELKAWAAAEPIDLAAIVAHVEQFEATPTSAAARIVADDCDLLRWHTGEAAEIGKVLEAHYRNANLRVAVSGELINRLVPSVGPVRESVNDNILGARVQGDAVTWTRLFVRLVPDRRRLRFGVEASGSVASETASHKGPATIFTQGSSRYSAEKSIVADRWGIRAGRAVANARSHNETTGVATDFDGLPLIQEFARNAARTQANELAPQAARETEWRVAERARQRLDAEVQARLAKAERDFTRTVTMPLIKLGLEPTPVEMQTTEQRVISRVRLASHEQLGAYTPRTQAPGDSLISVQLHESAVNNAIERLGLEGKEFKLEDLLHKLSTAAGQKPLKLADDMPEGVTIEFAAEEAIRVDFVAGEAVLTIRVAKLTHDGKSWKDFRVRGRYRPVEGSGLAAAIARDGIVELSGKKLGIASQVQLRTIFGKVFSKNNQMHLVPDEVSKDARLAGLTVTQLEIADGWLALAIGPQGGHRVVRNPRSTTVR